MDIELLVVRIINLVLACCIVVVGFFYYFSANGSKWKFTRLWAAISGCIMVITIIGTFAGYRWPMLIQLLTITMNMSTLLAILIASVARLNYDVHTTKVETYQIQQFMELLKVVSDEHK